MSSGWVPPVVSAVKEYGQAAGHIAPSYIRMCVRCLVIGHIGHIAGHLAGLLYLGC